MRTQYTSLTAALARFLSPPVCKQVHQAHRPKQTACRWDLRPGQERSAAVLVRGPLSVRGRAGPCP